MTTNCAARPPFTTDQHRALAAVLLAAREELQIQLCEAVQPSYPKRSAQTRAIERAIIALDKARGTMSRTLAWETTNGCHAGDDGVYFRSKT